MKPRYDATREMIFDGKIRIWSFVKQVFTTKRLANRDRGVPETKPHAKWPKDGSFESRTVFFHHDNATTNLSQI